MQWFCLLVLFTLCWLTLDIIDITNPKKIGAYENAMVFVYLCSSVSWHWTLSISLTRQIGAYENAMALSTCVVQLPYVTLFCANFLDPFIMYVCFILTRFVPN